MNHSHWRKNEIDMGVICLMQAADSQKPPASRKLGNDRHFYKCSVGDAHMAMHTGLVRVGKGRQ